MVLLDSLYINNSGGKVLLDYLVDRIEESGINCYYLFDKRCEKFYTNIPYERKKFVKATFKNRKSFYTENRDLFKKILCFGNVPPPIKIEGARVFTYLHNTLILETPKHYSYKKKLKVLLQRLFVGYYKKNTNKWIVQSENVSKLLEKSLNVNSSANLVIPFYNEIRNEEYVNKSSSFLYVSSGADHKNHLRLLKAWGKLFEKGFNPDLHLTVPCSFAQLNNEISLLQRQGINIINHGNLDFKDLSKLYRSSSYIIYPSLTESFGLPLIEGINFGNKVIAADLPYTYAVIHPSKVFNPYNEDSIAEAVIFSLVNNLPNSEVRAGNDIDKLLELLR